MQTITSTQNEQIKHVKKLQEKSSYRRKERQFIVEGKKSLMEVPVEDILHIYVTEVAYDREKTFLVPFEEVNKVTLVGESVLKHLSDEMTPQGMLGLIRMNSIEMKDLNLKDAPLLIALERIQDPGNLGTIIRTADAVGASGVLLSKDCVDLYNPKVIRATMGSLFHLPIVEQVELLEAVEKLQKLGCKVYGAALTNSVDAFENDYTTSTCFVIGNEGQGLTEDLQSATSGNVRIPMPGRAESLNASIAASVLLYEALRQRK